MWSLSSSDKTLHIFELRKPFNAAHCDSHVAGAELTEEQRMPRLALQLQMLTKQHAEQTDRVTTLVEQEVCPLPPPLPGVSVIVLHTGTIMLWDCAG
jgi:hypothetical protein